MPATYRVRIRRFLEFYLGDGDNPVPFGGRTSEMASLDAWLAADGGPRNLLLTAPAAGGKSALLTHWIDQPGMTDWAVVFVPISIRYETNRPDVFFGALAAALADVRGERLPVPAGDQAQFYRDKVTELLDDWPAEARRCLVVIDGLDEATGWQLDTSVLPPKPPAGVRVLVSAREMAHCDADEWLRRIGWARARVERVHLKGLRREAVLALLGEVAVNGDAAFCGALAEVLFHLTAGDPLLLQLYVSGVLDEQARGAAVDLEALRRREPGFSAYFSDWMDQQRKLWEAQPRGFDDEMVKACLAILACAAGPLMHADLEVLVPMLLPTRSIVDTAAMEPIARFVVGDGVDQGYAYAHPKFGIYVREERLQRGPWIPRGDAAFLDWGARIVAVLNASAAAAPRAPAYLLNFYFLHLRQSAAPLSAWQALVQNGWRRAWEQVDDGAAGFARDVLEVLRQARQQALAGDAQALALLARCALVLGSLRSRGSNVPGSLLLAAVRAGALTLRTAGNLARMRWEPEERASALLLLAGQAAAEVRDRLLAEAVTAAHTIDASLDRVGPLLVAAALDPVYASALPPQWLAQWRRPQSADDFLRLLKWLPHLGGAPAAATLAALLEGIEALFNGPVAGFELNRILGPLAEHLTPDAAGRVLDLMRAERGGLGPPPAALIARLAAPRLAEAAELALPYESVLSPAAVPCLAALAQRIDAPRLELLRCRLLQIYFNSTSQWAAASQLGEAVGGGSEPVTAIDRLLAEAPSAARLDGLILMLAIAPQQDAARLLAEVLKDDELSGDGRRLEALCHGTPERLLGTLVDSVLAGRFLVVDWQPLLARLSPAAVARLLAVGQSAAATLLPVLAKMSELHAALDAAVLRQLVDSLMSIDDEDEQLYFDGGCARALPQRRDDLVAQAFDRLLQRGRRGAGLGDALLKTLAPQLAAAQVETLLAVDGLEISRLESLAPFIDEAAFGVALRVLVSASESDRQRALLALAPRFAHRPEIADDIPQAIVGPLLQYDWRSPDLAALQGLSGVQRAAVARLAAPLSGSQAAAVFALLVQQETDPAARADHLAGLCLALRPPTRPAPVDPEAPTPDFPVTVSDRDVAQHLERVAPALGDATPTLLRELLDRAIALGDASARARALFALLGGGSLDPPMAAQARDAAWAAWQAVASVREQARLLAFGAELLAPEDYRLRSAALVTASAAIEAPGERMDVLIELVRRAPDNALREAFRSSVVAAMGGLAPELAHEFVSDLMAVVDELAGWAGQTANADTDNELRTLFAWALQLPPAPRGQLLVHGLTLCAFMPRNGLLQVLAELGWLGALEPAFVASVYDSVHEVCAWYP